MSLPSTVQDIRARFVQKFPLWSIPAGPEAEERARQWTTQLAEQIMFEGADLGFGRKRADPGRPISKDAIAQDPAKNGGRLLAWDMLTGAGTGSPALVENPEAMDITGQVFVLVQPVNHLGTPPKPEPGPQPVVAQQLVLDKLAALTAVVEELVVAVDQLAKKADLATPTGPDYTGTATGQLTLPVVGTRTVTLNVKLQAVK